MRSRHLRGACDTPPPRWHRAHVARARACRVEDRSAMDRLRQQLRRSRAREAGLEAEAQFLAADAVR